VKIVGATGLGGLWAFDWAWQTFFLINRYVLTRLIISVKIFYLAYKLWAPQVWAVCGR